MRQVIALLFVLFLAACAAPVPEEISVEPIAEPEPVETVPEPTPVPPPPAVVEAAPEPEPEFLGSPGPTTATDPVVLKQGYFKKVTHKTSGLAQIIRSPLGKMMINLRGFDTVPGPGLTVVLHSGDPANGYEVGRLISASGNYPYDLDDDLDVSPYTKVSIYSKKYNVVYGEAELK